MDFSFLESNVYQVTVILGLTLFVTIAIVVNRRRRSLTLPPGPPGWPIIGNLPVLFKNAVTSNEDYAFSRWSREYGDVYMLRFGSQLIYVLSNADHVREAFSNRKFQDRQPSVAYILGIGPGAKGVVLASGSEWSVMRKFVQNLFRDLGVRSGLFADTIQSEVERFIRELDSLTDVPCWDVYELFYAAIGNITCGITFGQQYDYRDEGFKAVIEVIKAFGDDIGPGGVVLNSKTLCRLPFGPGKRLMTDISQFQKHLDHRINKTKSMLKSGDQPNSFVKAFIVEMGKGETYFDKTNLITCCLEMFFAGTETTSATLSWALLYLTIHTTIQAKCQQELDDYVNERGMPHYCDRSDLPYTQAVIAETERLAAVVPLGIPRRVTEDLNLFGYDFPKGTLVFSNTDAINMDNDRFPEPSEYRPERFVNEGQFEADANIMPFSVGRRSCLGEPLARMEIFLFLVSLLHRFTLSPPDGLEMPDYRQAVYGGTRKPLPFAVVIRRR